MYAPLWLHPLYYHLHFEIRYFASWLFPAWGDIYCPGNCSNSPAVINNWENPQDINTLLHRGPQALLDMIERAKSDGDFGIHFPATFGRNLNWDANYELRWVNFNFSHGRVVTMYQATYKFNSIYRYTNFYDPDTNVWTGWVAP